MNPYTDRTSHRAYAPSHALQISVGLPFNWRLLASLAVNCAAWGAVVALLSRWW